MKISDLILKLEEARNLHGELEIYHYDDWNAFSVEEVNFQTYKKNKNEIIKKKFKEKGVILTDNDIKYLSDSGLVTKYINKK